MSNGVSAPFSPPPQGDLVFVIPGAGNSPGLESSVRQCVAKERLPLTVEAFEWTHGNRRYLIDQIDYVHTRNKGRDLADRIAGHRQACPNARIYLVSHSAGSAVVLAAAESLPPDSLTQIVLLAPAVSRESDLRCALRTSRDGIDSFISGRDRFVLGFVTDMIGTADRQGTMAAGRYGFRPLIASPEDAALYDKLRQHPWDGCVAWTGNTGGHSGSYRPEYICAYVLPLLR